MKIRVKSAERNIHLYLPTNLIFGKGTVWLVNRFGRKYAENAMKDIPPEVLDRLFAEFRRIKRNHRRWELVEVQSSDGELIHIIL